MNQSLSQTGEPKEQVVAFLRDLTSKELEVIDLLANGFTNSAIADSLFIEVRTVEHHLNNIYSKLKAKENIENKHLRVEVARAYIREANEDLV